MSRTDANKARLRPPGHRAHRLRGGDAHHVDHRYARPRVHPRQHEPEARPTQLRDAGGRGVQHLRRQAAGRRGRVGAAGKPQALRRGRRRRADNARRVREQSTVLDPPGHTTRVKGRSNAFARRVARELLKTDVYFDWEAPRTREGYYRYKGGKGQCAASPGRQRVRAVRGLHLDGEQASGLCAGEGFRRRRAQGVAAAEVSHPSVD